jgi:hypothetical protein
MNSCVANRSNPLSIFSICFVSFAFYCLADVMSLLSVYFNGVNFQNLAYSSRVVSNLFLAPVLETIFIFLPLMWVCRRLDFKSYTTILSVALLFSLLHIFISVIYPFVIFWPALMMCCNYYYFLSTRGHLVACISTILVHATFNLTSVLCG